MSSVDRSSMEEAVNILRTLLASPDMASCMSNASAVNTPVTSINAEVRSLFRTFGSPPPMPAGASGSTPQPIPGRASTPQFQAKRFGSWSNKGKKRARPTPFQQRTFMKEVILLPCPRDHSVVRQNKKRKLHVRGFILNAFEFDKTWTHSTVLMKLREAFHPKIPDHVSLQMLMPCGNKLVAPSLCRGQQLDAGLIHQIFKRACIYVRPSELLQSVTSDTSDSDEDMETILTPPPHHSNDETPPPHHSNDETPPPHLSNDETPPPQRSKDETPPPHQLPSEYPAQPSTSGQVRSNYGTYISLIEDSSEEEDEDLYTAIVASMEDQARPKNDVTIAQILEELAEKINSKDICKFNINRANVLDGAIRGFRRLTYNPCSTMTIKFSDDKGTREEAIDLGGPKREFLRLLVEALSQCDMFEGQEGHLNLALDSTALREDLYYHAGTAVAVCLVHGGPSPSFLSKTLFDWIAHGLERCRPVLEDIGDFELRQKLEQISEAKTLKATAEPLTDYLATAGCLRNLSSLADKDQLVQDIMMFHVIHRVRGPFERFREGLKTLGILEKIQLHSDVFRKVLCYTPDGLSADNMDDLFEIRWSETGSNRRREENKVVAYWRDFLQDAEEESGTTTLQEILTFATGSNMVPPIGFAPQPSVEFLHNGGKYPTANTCINCLHLPIHASYDDFKNAMHFAIQNTQGFGMA